MQHRLADPDQTDPALFATGSVCELARVYGGRFRIDALLGRGGAGEVYAATDLENGQAVAFKVLLRRHQDDRTMVHRFKTEGRIGMRLRHDHIVPVHMTGVDETCGPFIVMERLVGATLAQLSASLGKWPLEQALLTAIRIADVVQGLHQTRIPMPDGTVTGIIHRDLKPDNLFMVRELEGPPRPVLLDFGLAKLVGDLMSGSSASGDGARVGTARYMSPEQSRGEALTPASDVYSLAIIVHEMISGRHVYAHDDADETPDYVFALWHQTGDLVPLAEALPDCPPIVGHVLHEALQRDLGQRFGSMSAFSAALMTAYQEVVKQSSPPQTEAIVAHLDRELARVPADPARVPSTYGLRARDAASVTDDDEDLSEIVDLVTFGEADAPLPDPPPLDTRVPPAHPARAYAKNLEGLRLELDGLTLEELFKLRRSYRAERAKMAAAIDEATNEHNQRMSQHVRAVLSETDLFLDTCTAVARRRISARGFRSADQRATDDDALAVAELTDKLAMLVHADRAFAAAHVDECEKQLGLARARLEMMRGTSDEAAAAFVAREHALRLHIVRGALKRPPEAPVETSAVRPRHVVDEPASPPAFVLPTADEVIARLEVLDGATDVRFFDLVPRVHVIGRAHDADVFVDEPTLSAVHAELRPIAGSDAFVVVDRGGRNGTFVQGERVTTPRLLRHGDRMALGLLVLRFHHLRTAPLSSPRGRP